MATITSVEEFVQVHGVLLASAGIPASLHAQLFHKLSSQLFDGGDFFHVEVCENGKQRRLLSSTHLPMQSQVFLVDHAWSFRLPDARIQLHEHPGLVERLSAMMCLSECVSEVEEETESFRDEKHTVETVIITAQTQAKEAGRDLCWLELDEADIDDAILKSLEIPKRFPNLVGLSLWGNKLSSTDVVLEAISGLTNLKALWLNENPVAVKGGDALKTTLLSSLPYLEIYNSQLTEKYGRWAVAFCAGISSAKTSSRKEGLEEVKFLDLSDRGILCLHPKVFNPREMPFLNALNLKGNPLDGQTKANLLETLRSFQNLRTLEIAIPGALGKTGIDILESLPNLSMLNGVEAIRIMEQGRDLVGNLEQRFPQWSAMDSAEDRVLCAMWTYLMNYRLCDEEKLDETPVWYVMDELGSAARHSDEPNFRVAPFMYMPEGTVQSAMSYSLLWPVRNVSKGEECTRDFLFGFGEDKQRSARLTAWFHTPTDYFEKVYQESQRRLENTCVKIYTSKAPSIQSILKGPNHVLTVYSDLPQVLETLKRPEFTFCDDPANADILWTSTQIDDELKRSLGLRDEQFVNQFPFEACIVMKHHLAKTIQQAFGAPYWFQTTYDMETEVAAFIGDYFVRKKENKDNLWIMKPWNMARTIDTTITDYLPALIRLAETGPKICQKYIEHPALFQGKKFDLRYIVLLRSLEPFEIFLSDVFWARISNNKYTLEKESLSDYETHFTVMNYGRKLVHVNTHDFVPAFEKEHNVNWRDIHQKVRQMLRSVFEGAFALHPEMHCSRSRAIYGVDVLLTDSFEPRLLEVTYCPDCTRACKYDVINVLGNGSMIKASEFFDDVFGCLFLNSKRNMTSL
ncbi:hypothetical protein GOP47_0000825 [Adiantum capillus-veneris]|uniref:Tubulin--tyrosine ligase-like protein 12 SET-like domain-containing protein n=1 Tax=Adiantum capillus-veneris TaxID=13818 RepID=A0A9D4ZSN1_ADICA|nr:hypothetical protein GOP47_0000825 [Adiantum capillus-veneris]